MSCVLTWEDDSGAAVSVVFDVDNQETHEFQTVITQHPVEQGADVTDHARDALNRFTLEAYVTDSPLFSNDGVFEKAIFRAVELQIPEYPSLGVSVSGLARAGIGALFGTPQPPKATFMVFDRSISRKKALLDLLDRARRDKRIVRVLTRMRDYENMMIEQISVTRSLSEGNGATFTIALTEIRFVTSETVDAPKPSEPIAKSKKSAGSKNAKEDPEKLAKDKMSAAKALEVKWFKPYVDEGVASLF